MLLAIDESRSWFDKKFLESAEELDKLRNDGDLMFQLVSMVEIDRMKLVQTRAILNYTASKYNLYGKDTKERALIDMYIEGMADLNEMILLLPICQPEEKDVKLALIKGRMKTCYFPTFEKALKTRISNLPTVKKFLQPGS
ncbi:glutathione S-transferase A1-like [Symphalangus syndactylus]|uniref:glutathione S-transferase A1-like n=1 Tax=Symphalangus syndactylus TaxID=9590 RepID=UPI0024420F65|nr:glutathione S-transferase A1-like [Symphalangus syndactylus]